MRALRLRACLGLAFLTAGAAQAQVVISPLGGDLGRPASSAPAPAIQRAAALALPFFDDFVTPRAGLPSVANWQGAGLGYPQGDGTTGHYLGGGAYVSNHLAVDPPTRGAATLDGLRANGLPYNPAAPTAYSATDTLTSQPIDLSGVGAGSNVYLSYAWQAGSRQGPPAASSGSTPVRLALDFLDSSGLWVSIWTFSSGGTASNFRQQIFAVSQSRYFHANFRFRFRATGNQNLSRDAFSLDYVYLNANRSAADTLYQDVALSRDIGNPLRRYTSLPAWQYAAASTSELNPALATTLNRLSASGITPLPVSWAGTVRELTGGGFGPAAWLSGAQPVAGGARQVALQGDATTAALPATTTPRRYRYQVQLQTNETNPLTLGNDSISRDLTLADYYAYDDGSAEAAAALTAVNTGSIRYFAYALNLSKGDAVKSVRLAPIFNNIPLTAGGENFQNRLVTVAVWADNNGQPADAPLATKTGTLLNPLNPANASQTIPQFQEIVFDQPITVSGRCYIGYGQSASGQFLNYGYDLNTPTPANTTFLFANSAWGPFSLNPAGALLVRAVMTNGVLATQAAQVLNTQFNLYPNPTASGTAVQVSGPAFARAEVLDMLGRAVWQQPAAEAGQPQLRLPAQLPAGLYLVRLHLPDGSLATRRLTLE